jgi:hypothetical protein
MEVLFLLLLLLQFSVRKIKDTDTIHRILWIHPSDLLGDLLQAGIVTDRERKKISCHGLDKDLHHRRGQPGLNGSGSGSSGGGSSRHVLENVKGAGKTCALGRGFDE